MSELITSSIIIGLALMFGLSILMTYASYKDLESFFIWLNIFTGFVVWSGLLPLWVLVATTILIGLIMIIKLKGVSI